jgi:phenylpropionate dioxygenase-like ring-hydroxylating dioxygenase large terminal subunit
MPPVEDGGLRCLYHGWLYDVHGRCLEQPGESEGSNFKDKVQHLAYPCEEKGGIIFTYMGPGEAPLLPNWEFITIADEHKIVHKIYQECNYLQGNEGNIDPQHLSYLHRYLREDVSYSGEGSTEKVAGGKSTANSMFGGDVAPDISVEETNYGFRLYTVRSADEERQYVRISNFIHPNAASFPALPGVYGAHHHVPIDDTHHWKFQFMVSRDEPLEKDKLGPLLFADLDENRRLKRSEANRYLQNREEMRTRSFIGMGPSFNVHDGWATVGEGPIQDRTTERLGSTDKGVITARKLLLRAIHEVQEGGEPPFLVKKEGDNDFAHLRAVDEVVDKSADSKAILEHML